METKTRRFTITIPPSMDAVLDRTKKEHYEMCSQNDMLRDLIVRGLKTQQEEWADLHKD